MEFDGLEVPKQMKPGGFAGYNLKPIKVKKQQVKKEEDVCSYYSIHNLVKNEIT